MKEITEINYYHIHLYYHEENIDYAKTLALEVKKRFDVSVGRFHEREVGPHPMWSVQLSVPVSLLGDVQSFICLNRKDIIAFIHPDTGDNLADHTSYIGWLGESLDLNINMFR